MDTTRQESKIDQGEETQSDEQKVENQGRVTVEGPRTQEEQFHFEILHDEMEWRGAESGPDTAGRVAELTGDGVKTGARGLKST